MKGSILVIDDELGIRRGCQRALQPAGYAVETAVSLAEGRAKLAAGAFDLVLLDVMMPDGRGMDLLEPIHAQDPETVVVIITGYATVELAVEAIQRGAYNFIAKPFTADVLRLTVEQGMEKRRLSLETRRLRAVEAQAQAEAQARKEMARLSEFKSRFTFIVAHELRAPVGGAQSLLRTLTRGMAGELTPKQREVLQRVEARLDQLLALVNDLLALAESQTVTAEAPLEPLALEPVLQEVLARFAPQAEQKQINLAYVPPAAPVTVRATEDGLLRLFGNLLGNAIKYTPAGGQVRLEVACGAEETAVRIRDTGIGIPAAALPQLGDAFFRAENARRAGHTGTGLGLSIVRQLLDTFGGALTVTSVEGEGSTFTVTLPGAHPLH